MTLRRLMVSGLDLGAQEIYPGWAWGLIRVGNTLAISEWSSN